MAIEHDACRSSSPLYLRLLLQLLPPGFAWNWHERSVGRHVLAAFAEEFHRAHAFFCELTQWGVERFKAEYRGWSFDDYEQLLLDKFGVKATVSDQVCYPLHVDNATADSLIYGDRLVYLIEITVDQLKSVETDVNNIKGYLSSLSDDQSLAATYLQTYKQSHTDFCWRDRTIKHDVAYDNEALTVDNANASAWLFEESYHKIVLWLHPSWKESEFSSLTGWKMIERILKPHTTIERRNYAFH